MKKLSCILLVLCMLFSLSGCAEKILGSAVFLFLVATGDDSADKDEVFEFVCEKEDELLKAKTKIEQQTRQNIATIFNEFNFELNELNDAFGIKSRARELPFDESELNVESVATKFESDYFSGNLNDNVSDNQDGVKVEFVTLDGIDDVVVSENSSKLKS